MGVIEAVLAALGLVFLVLIVVVPSPPKPEQPPEVDLAVPYREGLHAAVRMQRVAQDLEQQIYAEAAQHLHGEADKPTAQPGDQA
jgi:hypothetical protein